MNPIETAITEGIGSLGLQVPTDAPARLCAYIRLLERWNRVYNLTAVRRLEDMVSRHLLDSLSILPWMRGPRVLDVGSGAGLPGIPLAVARPQWEFYLLDSNAKRTRFMQQAIAELKLTHTQVVRCRLQDYCPEIRFASLVTRAYATLAQLTADSARLCAADGCLLAMKGAYPHEELKHVSPAWQVVGVHRLTVPGLDAERHLVELVPRDANTQANG
ncbi:MAG TPA: 16S rRNA (guanine(527)-N(7))-methyltransferase RsmG [Candidatus Competibacteraceae bacterium]|nr:16S rRNA (guanine(527)-N(7))-methyltransferase RsmG [Candidatus Competibacteraceae bacterium]